MGHIQHGIDTNQARRTLLQCCSVVGDPLTSRMSLQAKTKRDGWGGARRQASNIEFSARVLDNQWYRYNIDVEESLWTFGLGC